MFRIEYENVVTSDLVVEYLDGVSEDEAHEHALKHSEGTGLVYGAYTVEYVKPENEQSVRNKDFFYQLRSALNDLLECPIDGHEPARSLSYGIICGAALARPDIGVEINSIWMGEYYNKWYPNIKGVKL